MCLRNREMKDGLMKPLNAHGFSLIEVLVAASVITLSLFSTVAFIRKGQAYVRKSAIPGGKLQ
jgi:prepilin-type N-terminal cleavage/methylation domain-containing protein